MTIILSYSNPPHTLAMVADLILSTDLPDPTQSPALPTRFAQNQPPVDPRISRLEQKIVELKPGLVAAWAGSRMIAKSVLTLVRDDVREQLSGEQIIALLENAGYLPKELESVSFIFFAMQGNERVEIQGYNVKEYANTPTQKLKYAGSGEDHFLAAIGFEQTPVRGEFDTNSLDMFALINRAAVAFHHEVLSDTTHKLRYGGGFEVLTTNWPKRPFQKMPYAAAYWSFDNESVRLVGPIFSYHYHQDGILQIDRSILESDKPIPVTTESFLVGSIFLDVNKATPVPPVIDPEPGVLVNYLIDLRKPQEKMRCVILRGQTLLSIDHSSPEEPFLDIKGGNDQGLKDIFEAVAQLRSE